jgi:AcrR family transcriptional regulator
MARRPIDRRIARTRKSLHDAMLSLILKRNYEAITVEEICEAANVSRSTFYDHFTGKDDLKRNGLEHLRHQLRDHQQASEGARQTSVAGLGFSLAMFEHARDHAHYYKALVGSRGGAIALATIRQIIADSIRRELAQARRDNAKDAVPPEFVVEYIAGAYMAVLTWWLDRGGRESPQQMDAMFRRLATEGMGLAGRSNDSEK